ncbi:steroid receptor RNA activator 1 [Carcharodon carcharias]|uniref:steroid receptor RNA activator 1 n=1 Tax=Carcharodon carcharias TaxID=13397 RepID=UPI001B7E8427|nr:steroid receptor RNA activator 1 [Carcharodon carcharias]
MTPETGPPARRRRDESEMSDLFVKPGNQERGWNDPPQFSYGLQTQAQRPRKHFLTKRVPAPQLEKPKVCGPAGIPPAIIPSGPSVAHEKMPPPPPPKQSSQSNSCKPVQSATVMSDCEVNVEDVLVPLNKALEACRKTVKKQVCDDIGRRLIILQDMWQSGKLSVSVQKRMQLLTLEMEQCNWDSADEIHRSLMVDHVNEVGQWMVGVKRLIAETKNLPSDLTDNGNKD